MAPPRETEEFSFSDSDKSAAAVVSFVLDHCVDCRANRLEYRQDRRSEKGLAAYAPRTTEAETSKSRPRINGLQLLLDMMVGGLVCLSVTRRSNVLAHPGGALDVLRRDDAKTCE